MNISRFPLMAKLFTCLLFLALIVSANAQPVPPKVCVDNATDEYSGLKVSAHVISDLRLVTAMDCIKSHWR